MEGETWPRALVGDVSDKPQLQVLCPQENNSHRRTELRACWEPLGHRQWGSPRNPSPIPKVQGWASFPVTLTDSRWASALTCPQMGQGEAVTPSTGMSLH